MALPRYAKLFGAGFVVAFSIAAGCSQGGTGTGGTGGKAPVDPCGEAFGDAPPGCNDCIEASCRKQEEACCGVENCEQIIQCSRHQVCTGNECYMSGAEVGKCHGLIDTLGGPAGEPMKAAVPPSEGDKSTCPVCQKEARLGAIAPVEPPGPGAPGHPGAERALG